jgi:hypothetical protein
MSTSVTRILITSFSPAAADFGKQANKAHKIIGCLRSLALTHRELTQAA